MFPEAKDPIAVVGVSFKTLPIDGREKLLKKAPTPEELLRGVSTRCALSEVALISTCNRFELIGVSSHAKEVLTGEIADALEAKYRSSIYSFEGREAVRHLFEVSSGLDSLALGEPQILGQVKDAYKLSRDLGLAGKTLHSLFQFSFRVAKKVRAETNISEGGISISSIAVELVEQLYDDLSRCSVLVLGAGRMAELTAIHLRAHGCREIVVANRTLERAVELASHIGGRAVSLSSIEAELEKASVVIGSLQVDAPVITPELIGRRRSKSPLFFVDLGVPRNFSPRLNELEDLYLYHVDDLSVLAETHRAQRANAAKEAEVYIEYGILQFERWRNRNAAENAIVDLRSKVREICEAEVQRIVGSDLPVTLTETLSHGLTQKLSHELQRLIVLAQRNSYLLPDEREELADKMLPIIFDELLKWGTKGDSSDGSE